MSAPAFLRRGGALPPFASVWFDCDSTLATIEGVDELAAALDAAGRQQLLALTEQAMNGTLPLAEVYERRLHTLAPTLQQLQAVGRRYVERAVRDARGVVQALRALGKRVGIVSGGLLEPVHALAAHLGIDTADVHAVPVLFERDGRYRAFDRRSPLWRNGGKVEVLRALPPAARPLVFVGDGVTDLETQGTAADLFVGFGGVVARPRVRDAAQCWFATATLAPLLQIVLTAAEQRALANTPWAPLLSPPTS